MRPFQVGEAGHDHVRWIEVIERRIARPEGAFSIFTLKLWKGFFRAHQWASFRGRFTLLIVRPHANNFNGAFIFENLINETVLDVDSTRICALQIANQFLDWWGILEGIQFDYFKQSLDLRTEVG